MRRPNSRGKQPTAFEPPLSYLMRAAADERMIWAIDLHHSHHGRRAWVGTLKKLEDQIDIWAQEPGNSLFLFPLDTGVLRKKWADRAAWGWTRSGWTPPPTDRADCRGDEFCQQELDEQERVQAQVDMWRNEAGKR